MKYYLMYLNILKMRKSGIQKQPVPKKDYVQTDNNKKQQITTCSEVVEYLKSLSKSNEKCIENVILTPSQYPSCSSITINLTDYLSSKMTSTYIALEGESKIYKNKKNESRSLDQYFLKIRLTAASPIMYQLLDCIYSNIRDNKHIPPSLSNISISDLEEKTLNKGCLFINKMGGAIIEYKIPGSKSITKSISEELENLTKRDKQISKIIVIPIVCYRNANSIKVTFALKKFIIDKEFSTNVIDVDGKHEKMSMNETCEEDVARGLGIIDLEDECIEEDDVDTSLFNV
ncbi:SPV041 putative DNA-binding phosphoprotein [Swinepox virus]|uniref:Protein OPG079 n=1 Tax=Swinepox virus (strain Swine/Nebraska/17077-99/1999) TaxID=300880 RepID=Q8V3Q3_SWPV1|nr:DNA-binding phosphoprotein [Swinepox virus]AAL69780.1 SPV041 putative DNA-binding phosphoprotein [Swinepox virus]UED36600.1 DNA-binding phosphoprotein [Swinepox virus]UED36749.1 DNA-binding phosphoprotein [Swinepox virus]UUA44231.1 SPV041 [Swinepox virus]